MAIWGGPVLKTQGPKIFGGVAELVDAADSKSVGGDTLGVRVPPPLPKINAVSRRGAKRINGRQRDEC